MSKLICGDHPNQDPELHFHIFAEELFRIAKTAMSENAGAFTIGIFGSWGSGKTTLMRRIEKEFQKSSLSQLDGKSYKTVWFNAWKYDDKDIIWNALIQTILRQIAQEVRSETAKETAISIARRVLQASGSIALDAVKGYLHVDARRAAEIIGKNNQVQFDADNDPYLFINQFETLFKSFVSEYVGDGKLVIFIDDLDRCLPEHALTVLEALKLYFDQTNCIFILGIDNRIIEAAIRKRYKDIPDMTGREYIEKIIQLNFFLPDKDEKGVVDVLQSSMTTKFNDNKNIWSMIIKGTGANVRKAKQFIIAFNVLCRLVDRIPSNSSFRGKSNEEADIKLARLLLIQLNFPDFFEAIKHDSFASSDSFVLKDFDDLFREQVSPEQKSKLGDRFQSDERLNTFYQNFNLRNFISDSSAYAYIQSLDELRSLLKWLKFNEESN